jgi:hypothetical protein
MTIPFAGMLMRGALAAAMVLGAAVTAGAQMDWLSLCSKCLNPSVTSKSGLGTSAAVVEGKITRRDAEAWCANWESGSDLAGCVRRQMESEDARRTYRATADCPGGKITAINGDTYTLAGTWNEDVGKGRTKWRDGSSNIVGRDNASNGLAISQQWEVLCPASRTATKPDAAGDVLPKPAAPPPGAQYAVGQAVEARDGREWLRGRIDKIRRTSGANGSELEYDVRLDTGKRGIVPARMLRTPPN